VHLQRRVLEQEADGTVDGSCDTSATSLMSDERIDSMGVRGVSSKVRACSPTPGRIL
jgi:hypothetical protein